MINRIKLNAKIFRRETIAQMSIFSPWSRQPAKYVIKQDYFKFVSGSNSVHDQMDVQKCDRH